MCIAGYCVNCSFKVRSVQRTGHSGKQLPSTIDGFLPNPWIVPNIITCNFKCLVGQQTYKVLVYVKSRQELRMVTIVIIIRQPLCPVVGRRPQHAVHYSYTDCISRQRELQCYTKPWLADNWQWNIPSSMKIKY